MHYLLLVLILIGCGSERTVTRGAACGPITLAGIFTYCPLLECPYDDGTWQGTCFPMDADCEWSCNYEATRVVCRDAVRAVEGGSCEELYAAIRGACFAEDCL